MLTASRVMDLGYLEVRCMLLEIAATLDRYDRAAEATGESNGQGHDPRLEKLQQAIRLLQQSGPSSDRSERMLNLFSDLD